MKNVYVVEYPNGDGVSCVYENRTQAIHDIIWEQIDWNLNMCSFTEENKFAYLESLKDYIIALLADGYVDDEVYITTAPLR